MRMLMLTYACINMGERQIKVYIVLSMCVWEGAERQCKLLT